MKTYFSPEKVWRHLFFVRGLTADEFYTDGLLQLNIEQLAHMELKRNGYRRVVFYDRDLKLYCYDDESYALLRAGGGKSESKEESVGASTNVEWKDGRKSGIKIKQIHSGILRMGMMADDMVKRQMDAYLDDDTIKTAIVINDPTTFSRDFGDSPLHSFTAGLERKASSNENIVVFLYTDAEVGNFYKVDQYDEERNENLINIRRPNVAEIRNMLQYMRLKGDIRFRRSELDELALALHQAMALSGMRIKAISSTLRQCGKKEYLTRDLCYEWLGQKKPKTALEQLNDLIGMESVKRELLSFDIAKTDPIAEINAMKASRFCPEEEQTLKNGGMLHFALTGNLCTDKKTVAKLIGQFFYEIGYLKTGHVVEADRSQLVSGTGNKVEEAMGGVLFIDADLDNDYDPEAIDTLVKLMDLYKGKFIVVVAGYEKEIAAFLGSNPGLSRKFTHRLKIEDYSPAELKQIFESKCKGEHFKIDESLSEVLEELFARMMLRRRDTWTNGREVENFEKMLRTKWGLHPTISVAADGEQERYFTFAHLPEEYQELLRMTDVVKEGKEEIDSPVERGTLDLSKEELAPGYQDFTYQKYYLGQTDGVVFVRGIATNNSFTGSGAYISDSGYIFTCEHVIRGSSEVWVMRKVNDGQEEHAVWEKASVEWSDRELDVAILKAAEGSFQALPILSEGVDVKPGEEIYLWGFPFGGRLSDDLNELKHSLFQGYVSSIQKKDGLRRINANIEAKRGCSGAPVFSKESGRIIGVFCGSQLDGDERLVEELNYIRPIQYLWDRMSKHANREGGVFVND